MPSLVSAKGSTSPTATASQKKYDAFTSKSLTGAVVRAFGTRTPLALPGHSYGNFAKAIAAFARPDSGRFSDRHPGATAQRRYGVFSGKTLSVTNALLRTDTYLVVMTMDPVDAVTVEMYDTYTPVITMTASSGLYRAAFDTYTVQQTMTVGSLVKAGTFAKLGTDAYTPVVTMTASVQIYRAAFDTYTPVATMTSSVEKVPAALVTDSYVVSFDMNATLDALQAGLTWPVEDVYTLVMTMSSNLLPPGDVDRIRITERPYGRIRIVEI